MSLAAAVSRSYSNSRAAARFSFGCHNDRVSAGQSAGGRNWHSDVAVRRGWNWETA